MVLSAPGWLTYESFSSGLSLLSGVALIVIAVVARRLRRLGHAIPRAYPWAYAIWGVAGLLYFAAKFVPDIAGLVIVGLGTLFALAGFVGLILGLRVIAASRTFEREAGTHGPQADGRRAALAAAGRAGLTGGAITLGVGMATATIAVLAGWVAATVLIAAVSVPAAALLLRGSAERAPGATCSVAGPYRCEEAAPARGGWSTPARPTGSVDA